MPRRPLTARQAEVLAFIATYAREQGYPPTTVEIGAHLGVHPGAAREHITALQRKGYVTFEPYAARTLVLVPDNDAPVADELVCTVRVYRRAPRVLYASASNDQRSLQTEDFGSFDGLMHCVARWLGEVA